MTEHYRSIEENHSSINEMLNEYPVLRTSTHDIKGLLLYFPRTGMVMTPVRHQSGGWHCCVVVGTGYDLYVSDNELRRAPQVLDIASYFRVNGHHHI